MQESLVESSLYLNWLSDFFSRSVLEISVQQAWLNFIYNNSLSGQVVEGEFAPQQDILLACEDVTASRTVLYRYIWASNEWITLDQFDEATMFMVSTPDDSAVILQQMNLTSPSSLFLWQDGQTTTLLDSSTPETNGYYSIGLMSPDGRKLTMTRFGEAGYLLLDLEECSDSGCQLYSIPGLPEWSPDGSQMILELLQDSFNAPEINGLARVDRSGMIANIWGRGFAFAPFWLGEEEYGYIQYGEQAGIYAALVADDEPQLLLAEADLLQAIPEAERPDSLIIQEASPNPANHNILAVTAFYEDQDERRSYLFLWNRPVGELIPVGFLSQVVAGLAVWLSNGEWLVVPTYHTRLSGEGASQTYSYQLYHVSGEGRPITVGRGEVLPLDRSIDSEWLAFPNNRYVELIGLKHTLSGNRPYRRLLPHTFTNCRSALFIW
jgi:hypothetical protein